MPIADRRSHNTEPAAKKEKTDDETNKKNADAVTTLLPSWRELLTVHGVELWSIRQRAFNENPKMVALHIVHPASPPTPHRQLPSWWTRWLSCFRIRRWRTTTYSNQVMVLGCPHLFCQLEREQDEKAAASTRGTKCFHGLDKPKSTGVPPRPLNVCIGDEWNRQRQQVQTALQNLPQRSLEAARDVPLLEVLAKYTIPDPQTRNKNNGTSLLVDWKEAAVDVAVLWIVRLFRGHADERLEETCKAFWEAVRSLEPVAPPKVEERRRAFVEALYNNNEDPDAGVLASLFQSGLSRSEAMDNAINAMIAALDAAQALLFWTIWNLSTSKNKGWRICQEQVQGLKQEQDEPTTRDASAEDYAKPVNAKNAAIIYQTDLEGLATFKKAATQSEKVDYSDLSYLGRALCETVRVFPPVWTLPRTWPGREGESDIVARDCGKAEASSLGNTRPIRWSKLEIVAVNAATSHRDWDPDGPISTTPDSTYIASFGMGRRHCPGGTAALYAVYHFLTETFQTIKELDECVPNHALASVYLLPTLSLVGPHFFRVVYYERASSIVERDE